jgi:GNAT superfamily N-acetyltransferase
MELIIRVGDTAIHGTLFRDVVRKLHYVFAPSAEIAEQLLQHVRWDAKEHGFIGFGAVDQSIYSTVEKVAQERGFGLIKHDWHKRLQMDFGHEDETMEQVYDRVSSLQEHISKLLASPFATDEGRFVEIGSLTSADAALVETAVQKADASLSEAYIKHCIGNGPSSVVRVNTKPAAFAFTHADGTVGGLYCAPQFRNRGLGKAVLSQQVLQLMDENSSVSRSLRSGPVADAFPRFPPSTYVSMSNERLRQKFTELGFFDTNEVSFMRCMPIPAADAKHSAGASDARQTTH